MDISNWKEDECHISDDNKTKVVSYSREMSTNHPLPISLPWLPVYVTNKLKQTIKVSYNFDKTLKEENFFKFEIFEKSIVDGIPLVQPKVWTDWVISEYPNEDKIHIKIYLWFEDQNLSTFDVITPLVELHSSSELSKYFKLWQETSEADIKASITNDKMNYDKTNEHMKKILPILDELDNVEFQCYKKASPRNSPRRRRNSQRVEIIPIESSSTHLLSIFFAFSICILFAKFIDSTLRVAISMILKRIENITVKFIFRVIGSIVLGSCSGIFCHFLKKKFHTALENSKDNSLSSDSNDSNSSSSSSGSGSASVNEKQEELSSQAVTTIETTNNNNNNNNNSNNALKNVLLFPLTFFLTEEKNDKKQKEEHQ